MHPVFFGMHNVYEETMNLAGLKHMSGSRKAGFTLIELLVYIGIVGIIVIVAGQAFSNSTKMRVRTQSMLKASEAAENVATLLKADIAQMGAKSAMEAGVADGGAAFGNKFSEVNPHVFMHPTDANETLVDSSSYKITTDAKNNSRLVMRRVRYSEQGHFQAVEEIRWFVKDDNLMRVCLVLDGENVSDCAPKGTGDSDEALSDYAVNMAEKVNSFTVVAASPSVTEENAQVFPPNDATEFRLVPRTGSEQFVMFTSANASGEPNKGGEEVVLSQFFSNYNTSTEALLEESNRKVNQAFAIKNETTAEGAWNNLCTSYGALSLEKNIEYEISFKMNWEEDNSRLFVPSEDHMSVGFRDIGSGDFPTKDGVRLLNDFHFFPPVTENGAGTRTMRFTPSENIPNVCLAFTFACYSPLVSQGKITIKELKVRKVPGSTYSFDGAAIADNDKKNVKALRFKLSIKRNGEEGASTVVVRVPSNGPRD